jgi:DHA1 family bicyclomycin/chloramphenicol resistance-like MFS transporter
MMRLHNSFAFIAFLLALSISGPLSINFYLALLPNMAESLSTNASTIQQTVSVYLIGFAGAQLIVGPLSDRFGRRPILIVGYGLFSVASLLCALATDSSVLIAGRFIQSLGGCSGVLISRAIVRDVYPADKMGRIMSYLVTGFSIAPLIAPAIGGYIGIYYGWRSLFFILAGFGFSLMVWSWLGFKETNKNLNSTATGLWKIVSNYAFLLNNPFFLCYLIVISTSVAGILTYTSASSFVLIEVLEVPAQYYGLLFSISALGMFLGSLLSAKLSHHFSSEQAIWYGSLLLLCGGVLLAVLPWLGVVSVLTLVGSMFIYALGNGVVMPSAMALAIMPFPKKAGAAAALIGCCQSALGAACGYVAGLLFDHSAIPMTSTIGLLSLLAFGGVLYARVSKRENKESMVDIPQ